MNETKCASAKLAIDILPCNPEVLGGVTFQSRLSILQSNSELEQFSTVVEKIYDAAADSKQWSSALEIIVDYIGASGSTISFGDMRVVEQDPSSLHSFGLSQEFIQHFGAYAGVWALQCGIAFWNVGVVHHLPDLMSREEFENGKFYREVLKPHGEDDFMGVVTLKEGPHLVALTVTTRTDLGAFNKHQVEKLKLLAPHICRAAKISFALELKSLKLQMLESSLDRLSAAVFIVSNDKQLIFTNERAKNLLEQGRGLKAIDNRLTTVDSEISAEFERSLSDIQMLADNFSSAAASIALPDKLGGLVASVLPLGDGDRRHFANVHGKSGFAIFVQDPMGPPPNPGEGFAKLYGLTQGEVKTLMALSMSKGPQDAADILGISITTVRSHLQHIFTKTNTSGQSELLQLMMRSAAPISA
jgi:DNA-binding CsgD family transcriptional regulator